MHLINPVVPAVASVNILYQLTMQASTVPLSESNNVEGLHYLNIPYTAPRSEAALFAEKRLLLAFDWLKTLKRPADSSKHDFAMTVRYASGFFIMDSALWKCDPQGAHKHVLFLGQRTRAMEAVHNDIRHRSFYVTHALLTERYWWPFVGRDVA
jgi:hypothetical protein